MKRVSLYDGAIKAEKVGGFVKAGLSFDVIRPGYDIQGRRRAGWTQAVFQGIPVYTHRNLCPTADFLAAFDRLWETWIGEDVEFAAKLLSTNRSTHMNRFRDGISGETVAPTHTRDGKMRSQTEKPT